MSKEERTIALGQLLEAARTIDPKTQYLDAKVKSLIDGGMTLGQALVNIADQQRPSSKPASRAESNAAPPRQKAG
ncbi:MAG: hypothetical protein WB579_07435 [Bryobacteraceae bacterium]